jgi:hypothetical protein
VTRIVEVGTFLRSVRQFLITANVDSTSPILVTLMMEALDSSNMSVRTRATRRNIPEDAILLLPFTEDILNFCTLLDRKPKFKFKFK